MVKITYKKTNSFLYILIGLLAAVDFSLLLAYLLQNKNIALLNPKGFIAEQQLDLMLVSVGIILLIALPTLFILYIFAWKYRDSNKIVRNNKSGATKPLIYAMWLIPGLFMLVLAGVMWPATHRLVPQDVIAHEKDPMTIQVVSMNWKWLFIYPEQNVASVNFVQIPVDTPITFEMTADESPMSSFWIPNLGGQLYSMTTHVNRLNLIAEEPGDYPGQSAEINGHGFSGMKFVARSSSQGDFDRWVNELQQSNNSLDSTSYETLLKPSENHPVTYYRLAEQNLFASIIQKYYNNEAISIEPYEAKH